MAAQPAAAQPPPRPPGFTLPASNGYILSVVTTGSPLNRVGNVTLSLRSRQGEVFYSAEGSTTPTSIEADFGSLGRIDVDFVPSGGIRTGGLCGIEDELFPFASGNFVGAIDFVGEGGFSEVHATSAPGDIEKTLNPYCASAPWSYSHLSGAALTVTHKWNRRFEFEAIKNKPAGKARFDVFTAEKRERLYVVRGATVSAGPGAFRFDVPAGLGHVDPPAPFSGSATYHRAPGRQAIWRGNLSVDFPGRSNVSLVKAGSRARMERPQGNVARSRLSSPAIRRPSPLVRLTPATR